MATRGDVVQAPGASASGSRLRRIAALAVVALAATLSGGCADADAPSHAPGGDTARATDTLPPVSGVPPAPAAGTALAGYDFEAGPEWSYDLPTGLTEVSGLAAAPDGTLWAHDDEVAVIYRVDPGTGRILSRFGVESPPLRRDFEGIAVGDERLYLVDSDGVILAFPPGDPGGTVTHRAARTELGRRCEVEGLALDPGWDALVVACKEPRRAADEGRIRMFHASAATGTLDTLPVVDTDLLDLRALELPARLSPSGVERHPFVDGYLVVAAAEGLLLELGRAGHLVAAVRLPGALPQAEGVAVTPDGTLWVASEGRGGPGRLLGWPWRADR